MTEETRSITFSPNEIVTAIAEFHFRRKLPIPKGKVVEMSFTAPPEIEVHLRIQGEGEASPAEFNLKSETVAAALVFYCINRSIPLPALARKQLRLHGDGLELLISNLHRH